MAKRIGQEKRQQIIDLLGEGMTIRQVSDTLGVAISSVLKFKKFGVDAVEERHEFTPEQIKQWDYLHARYGRKDEC